MYHSVHFDGKKFLVAPEEYLKKHTIVYQAPAYQGCDGLPMGNGDVGGMLYNTENSLVFPINKTDVIDYGPDGNFDAWSWQSEEHNTAPVSCGKIMISDGMPSFDWLYLEEYQQELSLAEGVISCRSKTPFSSWQYKSYVSKSHNVIVFEMMQSSSEPVERTITLEKWSSINLFHDYEQIKPMPEKNLFNVVAGTTKDTIYVEQMLSGTHYITALRVLGMPAKLSKLNGRTVQAVLESACDSRFTVLATVVTAHGEKASLDEACQRLDEAQKEVDTLYTKQLMEWKSFWQKSFINLPEDDYLENLYYFNLYQLNSSSLGSQPLTFAGLWGWYKDTRNWGHFYHWNHQQTYWGVYTSNHKEFAENYLEYRFKMLGNALNDAKKLFGAKESAFYSDVSNLNGYNALEPDTVCNYTVGAQIAMDFYRYYQYTGDETFLKEKAYPIMKSVAELYCNILEKEEDGVYRVKGGATAYESYWNMKETITDCAAIQVLFSALVETASITGLGKNLVEKYMDVKLHLYHLPTTVTLHNGEDLTVFSTGRKWDSAPAQTEEGDYPLSPFPACQLAPVFPSGYIGLAQKNSPEFRLAHNTARLIFDIDVYNQSNIGSSGHSVVTETAARLGMREDCIRILRLFVKKYQQFPNGFTHFADRAAGQFWSPQYRPRVLERDVSYTEWEKVHEKSDGRRTAIPSNNFSHCYFESLSNIMTGVNEMLLQSYDGIIRVFPATPLKYSALFSLSATRGFTVSSEAVEGDIRFVSIVSTLGGVCKVVLPWEHEQVKIISENKKVEYKETNGIVEFRTLKGGEYVIFRSEKPLSNYYKTKLITEPNTSPKTWNGKILGQYGLMYGKE